MAAGASSDRGLRIVAGTDFSDDPSEQDETAPGSGLQTGSGNNLPPDTRNSDAKRINECLKHFNALLNTLAAGILGAAVILPLVKGPDAAIDANGAQWCAIAVLLHIFPYVLNFLVMQPED